MPGTLLRYLNSIVWILLWSSAVKIIAGDEYLTLVCQLRSCVRLLCKLLTYKKHVGDRDTLPSYQWQTCTV